MTPAARVKIIGLSALAGSAAVLSVLALVALNTGGEVRLGSAPLLRLAAGYDRRAWPLVERPEAPNAEAARAITALDHGALAQYPYDTVAWLQLAYVDGTQHGGQLSPQGVAALKRSYDLIAVDPDAGLWRIRFALGRWVWLPLEVRAAVEAEAMTLGTIPELRAHLQEMRSSISDPVGRLTLGLWLNRLEARRHK